MSHGNCKVPVTDLSTKVPKELTILPPSASIIEIKTAFRRLHVLTAIVFTVTHSGKVVQRCYHILGQSHARII